MSNARNAERDPDEIGCDFAFNAIVQRVGEPETVGQKAYQKFGAILDITKNPQYPATLEVEYFGKELPSWYNDLLQGEGEAWRFRGKAESRFHKERYYTKVTIFWAGKMTNQPANRRRATPPPFDNSPIPPPPPFEYQDEIQF